MVALNMVGTTGQSNKSGVGNRNQCPVCSPSLCWEWDGGPGLVTIDDDESSSSPYKPQTGSMVPAFANTFTDISGQPLVVVRNAIGGTSLLAANSGPNGNWSTTGALFGNAVARMQDAIADVIALGHTVETVSITWSQGHKDALGGNDLASYQAATEALVSRWRTALGIPELKVYMELLSSTAANSSTPPAQANWQTIRDAQIAACAATDGLEMAFTEGTEYWDRGWLKFDKLHYNQTGLNYMGEEFGTFMAEDLELGAPPPPVSTERPTSHIAHRLLRTPR